MPRLFFIDEHNSSKQNGIGTYRDLLLPQLAAEADAEVTLISLNADCMEPTVTEHHWGKEIALPFVAGGNWRDNGKIIFELLTEHITDNSTNVFMLNHSPCADFIKRLREAMPQSKVMFTVHDQGWCSALLGDATLLKEIWIERRRPAKVSETTFQNVREYCQSEADIYEAVDAVVSISPFMHRVMREVYGVYERKTHMIWNGYLPSSQPRIRKATARRKLGFAPDEELVIFAGRPARHKGIVPLLTAIRMLMHNRPKLRCIMCGSMHGFADFSQIITPVASRMIFTGLLPRSEVRLWETAADVGVMPSYSEPFGYSAIEMADVGLPLVVSDGTALPDIYTDGQHAFVARIGCDVTNPFPFAEALADAITAALTTSPAKLRRMRAANHTLLREKFSIRTMAQGYLNVATRLTQQQ